MLKLEPQGLDVLTLLRTTSLGQPAKKLNTNELTVMVSYRV